MTSFSCIEQLYNLGADIDVIEEAIRRKDYYDYVHSLENKIAEKDSQITELKRHLELLKQSK